ncbi:N-acetylmuramoyl-L-alanine amidase [Bacillus mesophilus]|uniref:LysM peptidoglycan-binding domain-containing protein n=1 Tax=Bacillus mesophilus TaxID=1808955 RepID=A0A6M0Q4Y0_9BACI|nr:cell wall hydrolase [Bacillus mesophilus]MBM7659621.1 N-acetylmuramoyl-L-alanine amidase [Bacillus mesophilus]NEY70490.1 LysM peptidoglycan-binding domain-containing protein [Bacillus mesophilus]
MNWIKKLAIATTLTVTILGFNVHTADANTTSHAVKNGETFWKISNQYGVPIAAIQKVNNRNNFILFAGERIKIPSIPTSYERDLLARLVYAEAKGESYAGKVAVATVVLNRVDSSLFPNSVHGVITEVSSGGHYAFSPVANGTIKQAADAASKRAVLEALQFRGQGSGSLYFYNPKTAQSAWIKTRPITIKIGNHVFAR